MRRAWPWLLAFVLVAAQALAFMHRIAHVPHADEAAVAQGDAHGHESGWLAQLFAGHDADSCRLIDSLGQGGLAAATPPCAALVPALYRLPLWAGEALARWAALFDARGPPLPVR
jgi:hypothetical protein